MLYFRLLFCLLLSMTAHAQDSLYYLFIGTYTNGKSEGIYVYRFNNQTGTLEKVSTAAAINPSYLALSNDGQYLYAVNQNGENNKGTLSAFAFDQASGLLHLLNQQPTQGDRPCYVSIDRQRRWAIVAHYNSGSLSALPILSNGRLDTVSQLLQHRGKTYNLQRQSGPHVHTAVFSPNEQYLFSTDLGLDQLQVHRFHPKQRQPLEQVGSQPTTPGSGPRHMVFHPFRRWLYVIEELSGFISVFGYDHDTLLPIEHIDAYPPSFKGNRSSADIHISPDGRFLYASNRTGANDLSIFYIHPRTGKLSPAGRQPVNGEVPRNFMIDPTGRFLLVANQETSNIVLFRRNQHTGQLTLVRQLEIPNPVCLKMTLLHAPAHTQKQYF